VGVEDTARRLAQAAEWSVQHRTLEADLRSDLAQVLIPFATDEVGLPLSEVRQEGSGRGGRFDSMIGAAIIEYKAPRLLRLRPQREAAAAQALDYLDDQSLGARVVMVTDGEVWGILRDIGVASEIGEQGTLDFGADAEALIPPIARFAWRDNDEASAQAVLDLIGSQRATPVTSRAVISYLGPARSECLSLITLLGSALEARVSGQRTDVLFNQWIRTAGISYGIAAPDAPWPTRGGRDAVLEAPLRQALDGRTFAETVYTLHTYVAIAAKLVAAEVLAFQQQQPDLRPTQWVNLSRGELVERLNDLESGVLSDQLGAPGLLASDLFDWYAHEAHTSPDLADGVRAIIGQLAHLAWAQIANAGGMKIDLLRDLYQSIVPRPLRKGLGEFFTPQWLAEYVFARALQLREEHGDWQTQAVIPRILDPSCGSGTFLVAAARTGLQRLDRADEGASASALGALVDAIIGIDINPVSALMARVNLLLALGDRAALLPEVTFHVFQADSIVLPRVVTDQLDLDASGDFITVSTAIGDFQVPSLMMTGTRMAILRRNLEVGLRESVSEDLFLQILRSQLLAEGEISAVEVDEIRDVVLALYQQMCVLRDEGRDDVWARVLEQFVSPYLLEDVDLVVGNPPWVSWKDLPDAWKERSEPIWRAWGLWRTSGRQGIPLSDVSTLLLARSMVTYAPTGVVAMLLPQSVQLADPGGNAFRRSQFRPESADRTDRGDDINVPFRVLAIDDFVVINPFSPDASNQTIALYAVPNTEPVFPIPGTLWRRVSRQQIRAEWPWARAEERLTAQQVAIAPVDPDNRESPWGLEAPENSLRLRAGGGASYSFGRGFETRGLDGLFLFAILTPEPTRPNAHIRVRNDPEAGRNTAGETARQGVVEAAFFWPLVKGEDVQRWVVASTDRYVLVPYIVDGVSVADLDLDTAASDAPRLLQFAQPWLARYQGRSMYRRDLSDEFPWELSGPVEHLRAEGALVFVRYLATGGRPAAAVREPSLDQRLGRTTLPLPNNKSNIYYTSDPDEAHFIAAFINSEPAQSALARFAVSTGVTPAALARLPMPRFDPANESHIALAVLGRAAATDAADGNEEGVQEAEAALNAIVEQVAEEVADDD
jgi:N-6 DNA Methylase